MLFVPRAARYTYYRYSTIIILVQSIVVVTPAAAASIDAKSTSAVIGLYTQVQLLRGLTTPL